MKIGRVDRHRLAYYQNVMHYSAYRGISIESNLNATTLYFQNSAVVETMENKQRNAAEFLGSILHHGNSFSML